MGYSNPFGIVHVETIAAGPKAGHIHPGRFGWTGGFGTTAYTDPAEGMIGILFTQRMMDSPEPPKVFTDFWTLAYQAISRSAAVIPRHRRDAYATIGSASCRP